MGTMQQPTASPFGSLDYFKQGLKNVGGNYKFGNRDLGEGSIAGILPGLWQGIAQQTANMPGYYNQIQQGLTALDPAQNAMHQQTMRQNNMAGAQDQITGLISQLIRGGAGIGARQGAGIAGVNQANQQANQYGAQQASPEEQLKQLQGMIQLRQMLLQNPLLADALQYYGVKMQNRATQSQGALGGLGQLAGMATGMGWKPF